MPLQTLGVAAIKGHTTALRAQPPGPRGAAQGASSSAPVGCWVLVWAAGPNSSVLARPRGAVPRHQPRATPRADRLAVEWGGGGAQWEAWHHFEWQAQPQPQP